MQLGRTDVLVVGPSARDQNGGHGQPHNSSLALCTVTDQQVSTMQPHRTRLPKHKDVTTRRSRSAGQPLPEDADYATAVTCANPLCNGIGQ